MSELSYACDLCGWYGNLEPCPPLMDAPCPNCGHLLFPRTSAAPRSGVLRRGSSSQAPPWTRRQWLMAVGAVGGVGLLVYLLNKRNRRRRFGEHGELPDALELGDKRTTPAPCADVLSVLPELAQQQKTTVRLHPRPLGASVSLPPDASKLGGEFLWPRGEPWPTCTHHQLPFAGILQLRQADFPEVMFKPGTDLLQVMWCPQSGHGRQSAPEPKLFWRRAADATPVLAPIPQPRLPSAAESAEHGTQETLAEDIRWLQLFETKPDYIRSLARGTGRMPEPPDETQLPRSFLELPLRTEPEFQAARQAAAKLVEQLAARRTLPTFAERELLPTACRLFPERVVEYPAELSPEQHVRLAKLNVPPAKGYLNKLMIPNAPGIVYHQELSTAPGVKLGGYARAGGAAPKCEQGHPMDHLLSIGTTEWDILSMRRWLPVEEQELYARAFSEVDGAALHTMPAPTGLSCRHQPGGLALFICRQCPDWPTTAALRA